MVGVSVLFYNLRQHKIFPTYKMASFKGDQWVLVGDKSVANELTQKQMEVCSSNGIQLKGLLWCDEDKSSEMQVCTALPAFPALCHPGTSKCFSGLNMTTSELNALQAEVEQ